MGTVFLSWAGAVDGSVFARRRSKYHTPKEDKVKTAKRSPAALNHLPFDEVWSSISSDVSGTATAPVAEKVVSFLAVVTSHNLAVLSWPPPLAVSLPPGENATTRAMPSCCRMRLSSFRDATSQRWIVPSDPALARSRPFGENDRDCT